MLMTITRGKAGRVAIPGLDATMGWRDVFRRNEDLLTGVLFSRMRFLSPHGLCQVMALLLGQDYAADLGEIESIDLWPRLENLTGRKWVEPDVLMRFARAFVLVELKPPFGGGQSTRQWTAEVEALMAEGELGGADQAGTLHFIALGNTGRRDGEVELLLKGVPDGVDIHVHCREWNPICQAVPNLANESKGADAAVFQDWLEAFSLFGLSIRPVRDWSSVVSWMKHRALMAGDPWLAYNPRKIEKPLSHGSGLHETRWHELVRYTQEHKMGLPTWI
jgi:hypothetical protein